MKDQWNHAKFTPWMVSGKDLRVLFEKRKPSLIGDLLRLGNGSQRLSYLYQNNFEYEFTFLEWLFVQRVHWHLWSHLINTYLFVAIDLPVCCRVRFAWVLFELSVITWLWLYACNIVIWIKFSNCYFAWMSNRRVGDYRWQVGKFILDFNSSYALYHFIF